MKIKEISCKQIHPQVVTSVRKAISGEDHQFKDLARFFKAFGDCTRLKILMALSQSEMCVCDIAAVLGMQHSAISHQLSLLNRERLVKHRREGKVIYYSLNDSHVKTLLRQGVEHMNEPRKVKFNARP
jgi:ArsR family transcriptional regulator, lead/cadmium/zinc/bismuth-responsive transcriptional repressor